MKSTYKRTSKDYTGLTVSGKLVIGIDQTRSELNGRAYWLCQCQCGNISSRVIYNNSIPNGCVKCSSAKRFASLIGQKFGEWTVLEYKSCIPGEKTGRYICKCKCGEEHLISSTSLKKGKSKQCRRCYYASQLQHPIGRLWKQAKGGAKLRNLSFNVTKDDMWNLFEKQGRKCALSGLDLIIGHYRNDTLGIDDRHLTTASLDRIDSNRGYEVDNIQWIHKRINQMKWYYPQNEFIEYCKLIANYNS